MTCQYTENISSLIDGELSTTDALTLERHVRNCRECQEARADFLNLRSEIVAFNSAVDRSASERALADVLTKIQMPKARPARANTSVGLFGDFRFKPAFAAIALLVVGGVLSFLIYRNSPPRISTNQPNGKVGGLMAEQNSRKTPSPERPAPSASPTPSRANSEGTIKPNESKRPKQRTRQPGDVPKVRRVPNDLISPWSNQAIAVNKTTEEAFPEGKVVGSDTAGLGSLTARHLGQLELLLRSFRNVRTVGTERRAEVDYERSRAQKLVYQNILLRREADAKGDVQVATLLDSLEPILLDIANLPERPLNDDVRAIKERLQRKNLVALLQVNSTALARANE